MSVSVNVSAAGVATIAIERDEKRNALNTATVNGIADAASELALDKTLRAVVLCSAGARAFSAGADITELSALDQSTAFGFIDNLRRAIQAVFDLPVPVICRIQGACIGGAMEMAAACDLRIASDNASFCMPEVRVGIPSVIQAAMLPRIMGRGRAGWLVLSGDVIDARTAYDWGFVEKLVAPEQLDNAVDEALASILASAPEAVRTQKRLLKDWDSLPLDQAITASMETFASSYKGSEPEAYMAHIVNRKAKA
ncbi:MAG: enoyl-CoA hydratase [Rhodospirillales bacterium]